ncbi:thioesterase domain-containing protein, partial [Rhodococcus sp. NPDC047139]|uniref:thioesterase domain-containing protein n=1 Tax=Rhodococcus sp. NPDC047139 TaxID=3155141 RepID=UPI0033D77448
RRALPEPVFEAGEFRAPVTPVQQTVAAVFGEVLGLERVGLDDDFFALGGNSLSATQVVSRIGAALEMTVPVQWVFTDPTVETMSRRVLTGAGVDHSFSPILPLQDHGTETPIFFVHPIVGLAWCYSGLVRYLKDLGPVYGVQSCAIDDGEFLPETLDEIASRYLEEIRKAVPSGPYRLAGWSLGGVIAHAMAVRLQAAGEKVELLCMMDSFTGTAAETSGSVEVSMKDLLAGFAPEDMELGDGGGFDPDIFAAELADRVGMEPDRVAHVVDRLMKTAERNSRLMYEYEPGQYAGDLLYFTAAADDPAGGRGVAGWRHAVTGEIHEHAVPVTHWQMTSQEALAVIGPILRRALEGSDEG